MTVTNVTHILWTSGWDSTFRLADLVLFGDRPVQPWYVLDSSRRSSEREIKAQQEIRAALARKDSTVSNRLLPTMIVNLDEIPPDSAISERWSQLRSRSFLGTQYEWLARLAKHQGLTLELSVHRDDTVHVFLKGKLDDSEYGAYRLAATSDDALRLFDSFLFPLFNMSKVEMQEQARAKKFEDIMEMTWFCAFPMPDGHPCAYCNPCRYTRDEGMGRRVPPTTLGRWAQYRVLKSADRTATRFRRYKMGLVRRIGVKRLR